jgi:excinuclease ABC subunit C
MINIKNIPHSPGVYKMKDKEGTIIYVGKAKDLSKRVKTYFQKDYAHSTRTRKMIESTKEVEYIETDSELEALLLENNLIKELRPRYNILMKDDKSYVYIKVNLDEDFPRVRLVRERGIQRGKEEKETRYFGPKLATSKVYETLRMLKKLFPFRHCQLDIKFRQEARVTPQCHPRESGDLISKSQKDLENLPLSPDKERVEVTNKVIDFPCLDYYIKRCPGPCIGAISPEAYKKIVQQVMNFLDGKSEDLEKSLKAQMVAAASDKLFEKAARLRDKLFAIQSITERQKITDLDRQDTDIINFTAELGRVFFNVFMVRGGKLISQENFMLDAFQMNEKEASIDIAETFESFILQYYEKAADIPKEILIPDELEDKEIVEKWLTEKKKSTVKILNPQRGEKNKLLELSLKNAISFAKQYRIKWMAEEHGKNALVELAEAIKLKDKKLYRIEGYDISHLGGTDTVGSMVVFENGAAKSSDYRHFKLRTVINKPDDYKSMEEVLMRRLKYLVKPENIIMRKARKKDIPLITKWGKTVDWKELFKTPDWQNFFIFIKEKTPVGMARLVELEKGIFALEALYIPKEHRGNKLSYAIIEKLVKKVKNKHARFYISTEEHLKNHYLNFGFVEVKQAPLIFQKRHKEWEKFDNKKYTILAYYKSQKKASDKSFSSKPDLILIDGGKGQLSTALMVLKRLRLEIPVISLAKNLEEIYLPSEKAPILLEEGEEALKLLQRIRDESHRFAIEFHRKLHGQKLLE